MRTAKFLSFGLVLAWLSNAAIVYANVEIPPAYDARSTGMGSSGVAHAQNGASIAYNPAAMQGVEKGAITLSFAPLLPQMSTPLLAPDTSVKSSRSLFPAFLAGGVYRINERLAVGAAVFPTMGFGAKYSNVPQLGGLNVSATLAAIEMAPGVSYALTDFLSIGATYRVTYMWLSMERPTADPNTGALFPTKISASGWNFLGAQLGLFAHATKSTHLGLTYRNKASVSMSGKTEVPGASFDTDVDFASPHTFKLGIAQQLLDNSLTLAVDFKLSLYKELSKELAFKADVPQLGTQTTTMPLNWKNTLGVYAGGEYRVDPQGPAVRLGYSVSQSATPSNYAQPILPPPGLQHAVHVGAGMTFAQLDLNLGGYYLFSSGKGNAPTAMPGDYSLNAILIALGGTYRM
jgi:long-chain fatty acid transport protein